MRLSLEIDAKLFLEAMRKAPVQLARNFPAAGREAMAVVLDSPGARKYPPATEANFPPTPYYKRGVGMQYKNRNDGRSEKYGASWDVKSTGYETIGKNSASYSGYLGDEEKQAEHMAKIGWRKIIDIANEKVTSLVGIFNQWVAKSLREAGF